MCDYSLMHEPNRLARAGEQLTVHRFRTGSIGLVAAADREQFQSWQKQDPPKRSFFDRLLGRNRPTPQPVLCAVCVMPGARLLLCGIPDRLRRKLDIAVTERVTFTQISAEVNEYRDAVEFTNGHRVGLQDLSVGQSVHVLALSSERFADGVALPAHQSL